MERRPRGDEETKAGASREPTLDEHVECVLRNVMLGNGARDASFRAQVAELEDMAARDPHAVAWSRSDDARRLRVARVALALIVAYEKRLGAADLLDLVDGAAQEAVGMLALAMGQVTDDADSEQAVLITRHVARLTLSLGSAACAFAGVVDDEDTTESVDWEGKTRHERMTIQKRTNQYAAHFRETYVAVYRSGLLRHMHAQLERHCMPNGPTRNSLAAAPRAVMHDFVQLMLHTMQSVRSFPQATNYRKTLNPYMRAVLPFIWAQLEPSDLRPTKLRQRRHSIALAFQLASTLAFCDLDEVESILAAVTEIEPSDLLLSVLDGPREVLIDGELFDGLVRFAINLDVVDLDDVVGGAHDRPTVGQCILQLLKRAWAELEDQAAARERLNSGYRRMISPITVTNDTFKALEFMFSAAVASGAKTGLAAPKDAKVKAPRGAPPSTREEAAPEEDTQLVEVSGAWDDLKD